MIKALNSQILIFQKTAHSSHVLITCLLFCSAFLEKKTSKISSFQKCHSFGINWTRKMFSLKLKQNYLFITWLKIHPSHFYFIFVFFNFYMTSQCFFSSLLDQVKSHHCKATVGVLHAAKSRSLKHWKELVWCLLS